MVEDVIIVPRMAGQVNIKKEGISPLEVFHSRGELNACISFRSLVRSELRQFLQVQDIHRRDPKWEVSFFGAIAFVETSLSTSIYIITKLRNFLQAFLFKKFYHSTNFIIFTF